MMRGALLCQMQRGTDYYQAHTTPSTHTSNSVGITPYLFSWFSNPFRRCNMFRKIDKWMDEKVEALPKPTPLGFLLALVIFEVLLWIL